MENSVFIIARYLERKRSMLSGKSEDELRQHLAGVASEAGLKLSESDLDWLITPMVEIKPKKARIKASAEKGDNTTSGEI